MEKQGIIAGVGNEITPEIDAVLNDFIVGKNTIISGLDWNGNTLNAGVCQLCGYRGVLEHPINNLTDDYVYGKFELHFDKNIEDKFSIETSASRIANDNPTSITIEGTYYLLLYYKKKGFDEYNYPNRAHTSSRSAILVENGIIESTATTAMSKTAEGNLRVNMHKTDPQMVANTEYVHKQIQTEIDEKQIQLQISLPTMNSLLTGTITLKRRAKYIIAEGSFSGYVGGPYGISRDTVLCSITDETFLPTQNTLGIILIEGSLYVEGGTYGLHEIKKISIETNGNIVLKDSINVGSDVNSGNAYAGYECQ